MTLPLRRRLQRLLLSPWNLRAQLWMQPEVREEQVRTGAARAYRGAGFQDPGVA